MDTEDLFPTLKYETLLLDNWWVIHNLISVLCTGCLSKLHLIVISQTGWRPRKFLLLLLRRRYSIERWSGILSIYMKNQGPNFKMFPRLIDSTNIYEHPCISILAWGVINSSKQKTGSVCTYRVYSQLEATDIE